ncbi:hypothetical protein EJB05_13861, partial [Eragrostis curvula]
MATPAQLLDENIEEILLRIPPDDPARLINAALVCKPWCGLISGRRFRHRYHEFHRKAPMLGFFYDDTQMTRFIPTSSFRTPHAKDRVVMDARYGRVLLCGTHAHVDFEVWDPFMDERTALPSPPLPTSWCKIWFAAVLCAANNCNHLDCRGGPILVVFMGSTRLDLNLNQYFVCIYSSEDRSWSEPIYYAVHPPYCSDIVASTSVGKEFYYAFPLSKNIFKYNLDTRQMYEISRPRLAAYRCVALMTTGEGGLKVSTVKTCKIFLWSSEDGPGGTVRWAQTRVIELMNLLPISNLETSLFVAGAADVLGLASKLEGPSASASNTTSYIVKDGTLSSARHARYGLQTNDSSLFKKNNLDSPFALRNP